MGRQAGALPYSGAFTEPQNTALLPACSPQVVSFPLFYCFRRGAAGKASLAH